MSSSNKFLPSGGKRNHDVMGGAYTTSTSLVLGTENKNASLATNDNGGQGVKPNCASQVSSVQGEKEKCDPLSPLSRVSNKKSRFMSDDPWSDRQANPSCKEAFKAGADMKEWLKKDHVLSYKNTSEDDEDDEASSLEAEDEDDEEYFEDSDEKSNLKVNRAWTTRNFEAGADKELFLNSHNTKDDDKSDERSIYNKDDKDDSQMDDDRNTYAVRHHWTEDDDLKLIQGVEEHGKKWKTIHEKYFPKKFPEDMNDRNARGALRRRFEVLKESNDIDEPPNIHIWTKEDDSKLIQGLQKHGREWKNIIDDLVAPSEKQPALLRLIACQIFLKRQYDTCAAKDSLDDKCCFCGANIK